MLFATVYTYRGDVTEEKQKRRTQLYTNWTPPAGWEMKAHYMFADGTGGIVLAEASSAEVLLETASPWEPFLDFKTAPLVEAAKAVPLGERVYAWRDSVR
jgi:hypothetical protein